jgi:hypothetical protein
MGERRAKTKLRGGRPKKAKPKPVMPDNLRRLEAAFMRDIGLPWRSDEPVL